MSTAADISKAFVPGFQRGALFRLPNERRNTLPTASPEESELVKWLEERFRTAKTYRDHRLGMMDRWRSHRAWYIGSGGYSETGARSRTYVNMIYEKVEKLTADLTEARPDALFEPHTLGDVNMTEILNEMVPWIWGQQTMDGKYYRTRKAANLFGTSYLKVIHDKRFINQGGVVRVVEVPQWYIFPAPYATSFEDAPWVIECSVRTVGELEADYGVTVKPEVDLRDFMAPIEEDMPPAPEQTGLVRGIDPNEQPDGGHLAGDTVQGIPDTYLSTFGRSGLVIQKEMWIRDGTLKDSWDVEDDGVGIPKVLKRRMAQYPGGRQISWANGRLLYDVHNVYRDGEFPYVKFTDISIPDFWYGQGEVDQLIDLQLLLDDTHEIIKQTHIYQAIGKMIVDTDTGLTEDTLSNEPGEAMFVRGGTSDRIKWLQGNSPSNELYAYINNLQASADLVTGSHDVSRGINPTGVTAGKALQSLAAQANIRIRARQIEAQDSLTRLFRLMSSRVQQFSPSDLIVGVTGADPNAMKQTKSFRNFALTPADRDATFNINVNAVGNSPQAKEAQFGKLMMMAQAGFPISPETLIEAADLPQEKKILRDMAVQAVYQNVPPEAPGPRPAPASGGPPKPGGAGGGQG